MSKKVKVSRISLQIGEKKKIELSLEEARELQQILADLLGIEKGDRITVISSPRVVPVPYPVPPFRPRHWEVSPIWVGADSNDTGVMGITSVTANSKSVLCGDVLEQA